MFCKRRILSRRKLVKCGIPQGSILGPLLFLILVGKIKYSSARLFADGTTLTVSGKSIHDAEAAINRDLANVKQWVSANKLLLNLVKTEYLLRPIGSRHNIKTLFSEPIVHVGDKLIKRVRETKALGVYVDEFSSCKIKLIKMSHRKLGRSESYNLL